MPGLIAEKIGMTQIFDSQGILVPVTVLKAGPCGIVTTKTKETDGYGAVQVGFKEVDAKKALKPHLGHSRKNDKNAKVYKTLREFRTTKVDGYAPGDVLTVSQFEPGDMVDLCGISKGKGFQGVMKRHHFGGLNASHGVSISHRSGGSIGQRTFPGKVFKGKRMAGRMGGKQVTTRGLQVVAIEAEQNLILIRGAVPGANHCLVLIHPKTNNFEKRFLESKKSQGAEAAPVAEA